MDTPGPLVSFDLSSDLTPQPRFTPQIILPTRKMLRQVPEEPNCYFFTIDNSSLEYFSKCARASEYYIVRSREPDRSAASLNFGGALHKGLEVFMRYGVSEATLAKGKANIYEHFESRPPPVEEWRTADHAIKVFEKYAKQYPLELWEVARDPQGSPLVEIPFAIPLGSIEVNDFIQYSPSMVVAPEEHAWKPHFEAGGMYIKKVYILWSGRMDAILYWDNQFWVLDHKTTSIAGPGFFNDFLLSMQTVGYTWAGEKILGQQIAGLVLNALICRKPTPTGKTIELVRRRYPYSRDLIEEWEDDVMELITRFFSALKRGKFPKQTAWCQGKYGQCKYHEVCNLPRASRSIHLQSNLFRDVTWNPLHVDGSDMEVSS